MSSDRLKDSLIEEILTGLIGQGDKGLKPVLELLFNAAMKIEKEQFLGAAAHERIDHRRGYANGYKPKELQTRMGPPDLSVPQVRGVGFYSTLLDRNRRGAKPYLSPEDRAAFKELMKDKGRNGDGKMHSAFLNRPLSVIPIFCQILIQDISN